MIKRRKKPTGIITPIYLTGTGAQIPDNIFVFPDTKEEIEEKIAKLFITLKTNHTDCPFPNNVELTKNTEDDLDFSLVNDSYLGLLELTEITPPGKMKGGYSKQPAKHRTYDHADKIIQLIKKKSVKYSGINNEIYLLMYITDDKSLPSPSTEKLVMNFLNLEDHKFNAVYLLLPILEGDGPIITYYPNNIPPLTENESDELSSKTVTNLKL